MPFAVPAVIVVKLFVDGGLSREEAEQSLDALRPHISADEHAAAELMLLAGGVQ